ncbi:MAG TPA: DUF5668 domain-containing protein [Candidatus Dormibacteraeota bacterium]|nr:DUF5668 domain-containing protein [Candidatus Dormibacteraeota bacterium]
MKCAVHTEADATGFCRNCGKAMCRECTRDVRGVLYCEPCLAEIVAQPAGPANMGSNPTVAFLLGFVPGLGAVYNGEYIKALVHVAIFVVLFTAGVNGDLSSGSEAALWICISAYWLYMAIDAHRSAKLRQSGAVPTDPFASWGKDKPVGPILLIALGVMFLLEKFGIFSIHRLFEFWPIFLIGAGLLMLRNRMGSAT